MSKSAIALIYRMIAFSSSRGGIFLMNQDGLNQQRILAGGGEMLRWEPR